MNDRFNSSRLAADDPMPSTSDFVKKLYKMLEDPTFQSIVSWGPQGDCFVVKDMNEFTKSILPRMFKHSNFASFVRQLNKYDFHKVKNSDDNPYGEHSWTFKHPDFHADRRDALENIKRKVPSARKNQLSSSVLPLSSHPYSSASRRSTSPSSLSNLPPHHSNNSYSNVPILQAEIQRQRDENNDLRIRIRNLERNYESVLVEMVAFRRGMVQQDGLVQNIISYFMGIQNDRVKTLPTADDSRSICYPSRNDIDSFPTRNTSSGPTIQELQTQLRQNRTEHERAEMTLTAQLNQVLQDNKEQEREHAHVRTPSPVSPSQPEPTASNSGTLIDTSQYGGHHPETNQFLPPHAVQHIIGSSGTPAASLAPNSSELGKASLLQMNEWSRKAACLNVTAGDGNSWNGTQFPTEDSSSGQEQQRALQNSMEATPARGVEPRSQNMSRGLEWENVMRQSGSDASAAFSTRRTVSEERERVGFSLSTARDDSLIGVRMDEAPRGMRRRRQSDSNYLGRDVVDQPGCFVVPPASRQGNFAAGSLGLPPTTIKSQNEVPGPWTTQFTVPPVVNMLETLAFNDPSSRKNSVQEDGNPSHIGLQVYTVGHLLPKGMGGSDGLRDWWSPETSDQNGATSQGQQQQSYQAVTQFNRDCDGDEEETVQPSSNPLIASDSNPDSSIRPFSSTSDVGPQKLRVRRSTYVPGWAVPPRVLLVDDDAVSRKLSSKFLQVFGCAIDVAVDGIGAVNKMNLEKYDLVLMDIVMPKLDGVSATNLIRKFDRGTPIISMTSNSKPNEIMTYYSSGMNDILPKPFTKEGLLEMLEKHLTHLKVIQQMSKLPRSIAIPMAGEILSKTPFQTILTGPPPPPPILSMIESSSRTNSGGGDTKMTATTTYDGRRIDWLAGMGLTNDQYTSILQNMVNGDSGSLNLIDDGVIISNNSSSIEKRALDELGDDGRGLKRSRFETIE